MKSLALSVIALCATAFDVNQAEISRQLSVDAYCGHNEYLSHKYVGAASGFQATLTIYNPSKDVEGYIGYLPSDNSIYVVFRGSASIQNWITNLDTNKSNYQMWPECGC